MKAEMATTLLDAMVEVEELFEQSRGAIFSIEFTRLKMSKWCGRGKSDVAARLRSGIPSENVSLLACAQMEALIYSGLQSGL